MLDIIFLSLIRKAEDILLRSAWLLIPFLCTCGPAIINGQTPTNTPEVRSQEPKREHRGVWMATVLNIDYPQNPTPSAATLQADFNSQLYRLRQAGINVIYLQVRPAGDAIYPSAHAPWSAYISGQQGKPPVSNFDPLAYAIKTAHAQGMEVHAWVNPYRAHMSTDVNGLAPDHLYYRHPEWVYPYNGRLYLDPGLPEVRAHLGQVIDELIANYDLNGIHFDDYFYPYPVPGEVVPDSLSHARYGAGKSVEDWRRDNVNTFVAETYRRIKAAKPWMQFSISPYGVWRNQEQDAVRGSTTRASVSSYDDLYGDALAWAQSGVVDYIIPQLYWSMEYAPASHRVLANWWVRNTPTNVGLLVGHAAYKVGDDIDPAWNDPNEIPRQIALARQLPRVDGSVFFSSKSLLQGPYTIRKSLNGAYQTPVLLPPRKTTTPVQPVRVKVRKPKMTEAGNRIGWSVDDKLTAEQLPYYYAIYRATEKGGPWTLIHRTPYGQTCRQYYFLDAFPVPETKFRYRVVPVDRYHREMMGEELAR
ncbi:MAG: family 10 glycosylhydrolase [Bacteroidota bacterium]